MLTALAIAACQPITAPAQRHTGATSDSTRVPAAVVPCETTPFHAPAPQPATYPDLPAMLTLPRPDESGDRLVVAGTVYAEDCLTPLAGALIEVWQANAVGEYTYLEGQVRTDVQGRYEIDTIKPGMYGGPAHMHFRVAHPTAQPIETELLFEGDPNLQGGFGMPVVALTPEEGAEGPFLHAIFDVVLKTNGRVALATPEATGTPVVSSRPCTPTPWGPSTTSPIDEASVRSSVGAGHVLTGVVRSSPHCASITHAKIIFWLANPAGAYDDEHRATVFTDETGAYRFESNFPGSYSQRPQPHIHLFVVADGYRPVELEYHPLAGQTEGTFDIVLAPSPARSTATPSAAAATTCTPTPAMPAGPNYIWNTPVRSTVGKGHVLTGVVKASPDCSPIAHARLEFWLAGPDGQYDAAHRATLFTDSMGAYQFESNYPGSYPERPVPHIHIFISAPGYRSLNTEYHPSRGQTAGTFDPILAPAEAASLSLPPDRPLVSMAGRMAFHSQRGGNMEVYVMNADGSEPLNLTNHAAEDWFPAWSPDGTQLAFVSDRTGNPDLYLMNADGSAVTNLTSHPAEDLDHAWSPDGKRLAFASNRDGDWELYLIELESRNVIQLTDNRTDDDWAPAWSPDGAHIAFSSRADIWVMNADGSEPVNVTNSPTAEDDMPAWSPDGAQLVFSSTRDGNWELYLMNIDGTGLRRLTDLPSEDSFPTWSPDGTRIAFKSDRDGNYDIYLMNADGSGVTRLTDDPAGDGFPAWQPAQP